MSVLTSHVLSSRCSNTRIQRNALNNFTEKFEASYGNAHPNLYKTPLYQGSKCNRLQYNTLMPLDCAEDLTLPPLRGSSCFKLQEKGQQKVLSSKLSSRIPVLIANGKPSKDSNIKTPRFCTPLLCNASTTEVKAKFPLPKKQYKLAPLQSGKTEKNICKVKYVSAAVRRQKFQQSRHPILAKDNLHPYPVSNSATSGKYIHREPYIQQNPVSVSPINNLHPLESKLLNSHSHSDRDIPVKQAENFLNQLSEPVIRIANLKREILPPVVPVVEKSAAKAENQLSKKRKNLLGEITHFPAVCNILPSKTGKVISVSTVPTLPPILPPPPAPPPSISASLEQESLSKNSSHEVKMESSEKSPIKDNDIVSKLPASVEDDLLSHIKISDCKHSPFLHTVSIVLHSVDFELSDSNNAAGSLNVEMYDSDIKSNSCENIVKTVMDLAELRREEFAHLLDEHAQIVHEIQRAEIGKFNVQKFDVQN